MSIQQNVGPSFESLHCDAPSNRLHEGIELGIRVPLITCRGVITLGVGRGLEPCVCGLLVVGHDCELGTLHVEGVGSNDAPVTHLFAQQASEYLFRQSGRHRRIQRLHDDVGCHDPVHSRIHRHAEGHQVTVENRTTVSHDRQA